MSLGLEAAIGGLAHGGVYSLLALGLVMIYRTTGILHFAHGSFATAGLYAAAVAAEDGLPALIAVPIGVACSAALGVISYRTVMIRAERQGPHVVVLASFALLMLIEGSLTLGFGADTRAPPTNLVAAGVLTVFGIRIAHADALMLGAAAAITVGVGGALKWTRWGLVQRAVADEPAHAAVWGLDARRAKTTSWLVASALAGVAGILMANRTFLEPSGLLGPMMKAFAAAVLGGLRSMRGAVVGAMALGAIEALAGAFGSTALQATIAYTILVAVLIVRPEGLWTRPSERRL